MPSVLGVGEGAVGARGLEVGTVIGVGVDRSEEVVPSPLHPQKMENWVDVGRKKFPSPLISPGVQRSIL